MMIQIWVFGRSFLKVDQNELAASRNTTFSVCCQG